MEKGFFKVFIPETSAKRLDNIVKLGDFFIFDYDETRIFYFKLLGRTGCVKKGVGGLKLVVKEEEAEEMNVEHQKSVQTKENTRARDSKNISTFYVRDENTMVEEKEDEDEECENTEEVPEEDDDKEEEEEEEDDDVEYKEEAEDKERTGILKKMTPHSKGKSETEYSSQEDSSTSKDLKALQQENYTSSEDEFTLPTSVKVPEIRAQIIDKVGSTSTSENHMKEEIPTKEGLYTMEEDETFIATTFKEGTRRKNKNRKMRSYRRPTG
ncbi:hypothetical protein MTR67_018285 [Solanum verrucosum]|uniref:Uncharacterized protein n=1 Tax=Solanum verrucosum TaxID=315347 RepID=A0AAF0QPH1_SOLVR|nr:hypothetical protein MTR67_018285 [Solanum verrucosum]